MNFNMGFGCPGDMGGFGDADTDRGLVILGQFNDAMTSLYSPGYSLSIDELVAKYPAGIIEGLGLAANSANMSNSDTNSAMWALARNSHGLLPKTWNGYFGALTNKAMPSEWMSAAATALDTVNETVVQPVWSTTTQVAQSTGQTIQALATVTQLLPLMIYGFVGLAAYSMWKNRETLAKDAGEATIGAIKGGAKAAAKGAIGFIV